MDNKGISIITLVITIIVIIILAGIGGYYSFEAIQQATQKDVKEEMRNVEEIVGAAKVKGLAGDFTPNSAFLITNSELDDMFAGALTDEQIQIVKNINADNSVSPLKKYYLLNQSRIDSEFGDSDNITISGVKRTYLVSYEDRIVMINVNGEILSSGEIENEPPENTEIKVAFTPNGSTTWATSQSAGITVNGSNIISTKYTWTESSEEPASIMINETFASGDLVTLTGETGNSWYIWVLVEYEEGGVTKRYLQRSNQFYIDNTEPTGELDVKGIIK